MMKERSENSQKARMYKKRPNNPGQNRYQPGQRGYTNYSYDPESVPKNNNNDHPKEPQPPPIISAFITSETHTSETERNRNLSHKAKAAIEAGLTPPAVRAMKYIKEYEHTKVMESVDFTKKASKMEARKDSNEESDNDFDYSDLKLDLGDLADKDRKQATKPRADSDSDEFDFDEPQQKQKFDSNRPPRGKEDLNGGRCRKSSEVLAKEVELARDRGGSLRKPRVESVRMRRHSAGDILDERPDGKEAKVMVKNKEKPRKHTSDMPPLPNAKKKDPLNQSINLSRDLERNPSKASHMDLDAVLATPSRRRKNTESRDKKLDIIATPNVSRKNSNRQTSEEFDIRPKEGNYLDMSSKLRKQELKRQRKQSTSKDVSNQLDMEREEAETDSGHLETEGHTEVTLTTEGNTDDERRERRRRERSEDQRHRERSRDRRRSRQEDQGRDGSQSRQDDPHQRHRHRSHDHNHRRRESSQDRSKGVDQRKSSIDRTELSNPIQDDSASRHKHRERSDLSGPDDGRRKHHHHKEGERQRDGKRKRRRKDKPPMAQPRTIVVRKSVSETEEEDEWLSNVLPAEDRDVDSDNDGDENCDEYEV